MKKTTIQYILALIACFAVGCGILTYVIRFYSAYPEGVSFAILIMNAFVPLIDKLTPQRVYGTRRR